MRVVKKLDYISLLASAMPGWIARLSEESSMPVITASDAPNFDIPGVRFTGLAAPSRGARETSVWRLSMAPATEPRTHRLTREEVLVVLNGTGRFTIGMEEFDVGAGGAVIVPANTDFSLSNPHDKPLEAVAVLPVGGLARIGDAPPFTPPWAE
jgi:mannose-6-phosphate isomerase-like protein (cupin superfamily)